MTAQEIYNHNIKAVRQSSGTLRIKQIEILNTNVSLKSDPITYERYKSFIDASEMLLLAIQN